MPKHTKCVHTVASEPWLPALQAITIPNLRRYAERIGADLNVIRTKKFEGYPWNYERLQVWEAGREYEWNLNIDADTIMKSDCEDPTSWMNPRFVSSLWMTDASYYFRWNKYFERDGRNIGISDNFTVSSHMTHDDFWRPLEVPFEVAKQVCLRDERQVSEYCLSLNVARYGLKFDGALKDHSKHFSIMATTHKVQDPVQMMKDKLVEWGEFDFLKSVGISV